MNRYIAALAALSLSFLPLRTDAADRTYVEASTLTMVGKLFPDTPNPYNRLDTLVFKGFTPYENVQVRMSSGIAVAFRTDSPRLTVRTVFERMEKEMNSNKYALRGYDLYVRDGDGWTFAGNGACRTYQPDSDVTLVEGLDGRMKDFLLYLPLFSIEKSIRIGIDDGCTIEPIPNPFEMRIALFGSSFMHGNCTGRPGMAFPAQFSRKTGLQLLSLGVGGNCKMQPYFAQALSRADVDAYVFDTFSNPDAQMIKERLFPFIETIREAKPDAPLIFLSTIRRETVKHNPSERIKERAKAETADSLMREACRKYNDVYWVDSSCADSPCGDASADGVHPGDYGYSLWVDSVCGRIRSILCSYRPEFRGLPALPFEQMDVKEYERQYSLNRSDWDKAFAFLRDNDLKSLKPGRYELPGSGAYVMVQDSRIDSSVQGRFENHRKYVDLQYVFEGMATMYVCPMSEVLERATEYSEQKDVEFFNLSSSCKAVTMDSSRYLILFPGDAHMPDRPSPGYPERIRKIVVKIPYRL